MPLSVKNSPHGSGEVVFSVLVPTYNHAKFLPAALESLLAQTFPDWEAIVVDDGSTDNTRDVLSSYASRDSRIRPIHKENGGVASALNVGIRAARGQWICWLSSDDFFEPDKLRIHMRAIREYPDVKFFFTNFFHYHENTRLKSKTSYAPPP
ncbi:MAG TPA: glycosyltransferase family A protein, partial [Nitrospiraceae bacterium]